MSLSFEPTIRQLQALDALWDDSVVDVLYGGAKGGGKSFLLCNWVLIFCDHLINHFDIPITDVPISVGWMGRKQATDFTGTTLDTWRRCIDPSLYEIRGSSDHVNRAIVILDESGTGRVAVDFGGLDSQAAINKFNSAEYAFLALDQAEETDKDDISVLRASRRLTIRGQKLPYKGLFTANPRQCWLKDEFIVNPSPRCRFVRALPSDNPHLPDDYDQTLIDSFSHRPELLAAYRDGNWDALSDHDQVIKGEWIEKAKSRSEKRIDRPRRFVAVDPAWMGDDETVIHCFTESQIVESEIYGQKDAPHTATRIHLNAMRHNASHVGIETDGLGGPIYDMVREIAMASGPQKDVPAYDVVRVHSGSSATVRDPNHGNLRCEIWDTAARMMSNGDITLEGVSDVKLFGQLQAPRYRFRGGKMYIEDKSQIKKRLSASPDRADAAVIGWWMLANIDMRGQDIARRSGSTRGDGNVLKTWDVLEGVS